MEQSIKNTLISERLWPAAVSWGILAAVSGLLYLPYLLAAYPHLPEQAVHQGQDFHSMVLRQALEGLLLSSLLAWIGLRLGRQIGLGSPWLTAVLARRPWPALPGWPQALLAGASLGIVVAAMDYWLFAASYLEDRIGLWRGLLAAFYGAINEEISLRLFLQTFLIWLGWRLGQRHGPPGRTLAWSAIVLVALLFAASDALALFHDPGELPLLLLRVTVATLAPGLLFGWLYWQRGLEVAVLAHWGMDLVLYAITGG